MLRLLNKHLGSLGRGVLTALCINAVGVLIIFAQHITLARSMGPPDLGAYSIVLSWLGISVIVAGCGLDSVFVRYSAPYAAKKEWSTLRALLRWGLHLSLRVALGLSLFIIVLAVLLDGLIPSTLQRAFFAAAFFLPIWVLVLLRQALLRSLKQITLSRFPDIILRPVLFLGLLFVTAQQCGGGLSAATGMWLHALSAGAALVVGWLLSRGSLPRCACVTYSPEQRAEWRASAFPLLVVSLLTVLLSEIDKVGLGIVSTLGDVGVYSVAARLGVFTAFGVDAISSIALPLLSEFAAARPKAELQNLVRKITLGMFSSSALLAAMLVAFGGEVISFFGSAYADAYQPLVILCIGQAISAAFGPAGFLLVAAGRNRELIGALIISLVVAIVAILLAGFYFGAIGAAAVSAGALVLRGALYARSCRISLGIRTGVFG